MPHAGSDQSRPSLNPRLPDCLRASDLQGLAQMATQATLGVTGIAEAAHGNVYRALPALLGPAASGFVNHEPGSSGIKDAGVTGWCTPASGR